MSGVAISMAWPLRDDAADLARQMDETRAALGAFRMRRFAHGSRPLLDSARLFQAPGEGAPRRAIRFRVLAFDRGAAIGAVEASLLGDGDASGVSSLRIERRGPVARRDVRAVFRGLVDIWCPLSACVGSLQWPDLEVDSADDGAPTVGWLTFLSRIYGDAPLEMPHERTSAGAFVEATFEGRFDHAVPKHQRAVRRVATALGRSLHPLRDLIDRGLVWRNADKAWEIAARATPPASVRAAPRVVTPSYLQGSRAPLEPVSALASTAPIAASDAEQTILPFVPAERGGPATRVEKRLSNASRVAAPLGETLELRATGTSDAVGALPFKKAGGMSMSLEEHASLTAELALWPEQRDEIEARYHLPAGALALVNLRWERRLASDPGMAEVWKRRVDETKARLKARMEER